VSNPLRVLVIDIGGSNVKLMLSGHGEVRKFPSGPGLTPVQLWRGTVATAHGWHFDAISIGYPGVVRDNRIVEEPQNLGRGWTTFQFAKRFGCPVKIINDAAMQALAHARKGRVLFLGLGTGVGSALVENGAVLPLELNHLRYSRGECLEQVLSKSGAKRLGPEAWAEAVREMVEMLRKAFIPDLVVIGGGAAKKLPGHPDGVKLGWNSDAFVGGLRLWGQTPERGIIPKSRTELHWRRKVRERE
jgi:predicted NBD/HSP70 family sugar kinase